MFKYINKNNILLNSIKQQQNSKFLINQILPSQQQLLSTRNFSSFTTKSERDKLKSPLYHPNSTLYSYTPREVLTRIEKDFKLKPGYVPQNVSDKFAKFSVQFLRKLSNLFFKEKFIHYAVLLESVAAVPGLVAGMFLHLKTLRTMESNNWITILMDEMENERMHLLSFIELTKPTLMERAMVASVQAIYWNWFLIFYYLSPKTAHRFVGYLEEEAVLSYTNMLRDIDSGKVSNGPASKLAIEYWGLPKDATLRDMILVIRQDEADHREVNHEISNKILIKNNDPIIVENHFNKPVIVNPVDQTLVDKVAHGEKVNTSLN